MNRFYIRDDEQQQIDRELDHETRRSVTGIGAVFCFALLMWAALWCASQAFGSTYTRDGGTADFMCCADKACTTIISQHADAVRARDACGVLTDKDGITRYTRSNAFRITPSSTTTPVCPPKPADETQTVQCTAPQVGSWTQTRTYASAPSPTCWTASAWTPTSAPAGACTTPAPTSQLVYSTVIGGTFTKLDGVTVSGGIGIKVSDCALAAPVQMAIDGAVVNTENTCPFWLVNDDTLFDSKTLANGAHTIEARSGTAMLKATVTVQNAVAALGVPQVTASVSPNPTNPSNSNVLLIWPTIAGATGYDIERCTGATCTNFAALASVTAATYTNTSLPPGFTVNYRVRAKDATRLGAFSTPVKVTTLVAGTGSATLNWTPPTTNTDGSALTNLAGYRIWYGTAADQLFQKLDVANAAASSFTVTALTSGTWYFAVAAFTSAGAESANSAVATKVVN